MKWLQKLRLGSKSQIAPGEGSEQAVLLNLPYPGGGMPGDGVVQAMHDLQDRLERAILDAKAGELDGDEFGEGQCMIYLYGPSAERLWEVIRPVLQDHRFEPGAVAIKRFGGPGAPEQPEVL